jgi:hypothetical protein
MDMKLRLKALRKIREKKLRNNENWLQKVDFDSVGGKSGGIGCGKCRYTNQQLVRCEIGCLWVEVKSGGKSGGIGCRKCRYRSTVGSL